VQGDPLGEAGQPRSRSRDLARGDPDRHRVTDLHHDLAAWFAPDQHVDRGAGGVLAGVREALLHHAVDGALELGAQRGEIVGEVCVHLLAAAPRLVHQCGKAVRRGLRGSPDLLPFDVGRRVGVTQQLPTIQPGQSYDVSARLFAGPEEERMLEGIAPGLELVKDYGWVTIIAKPLFWLLEKIHSYVGNWGWAIVLLTLLIKAVFFPLSAASYKSMARMKTITPRMQALRERFKGEPQKMNQALMELYKTEKVNPFGGCLPVVIQIPVFISLYWVLLSSVEMRGAPWILWIHDLSQQDPFYILPVLMAVSMFIQTRLNPTPPDPVQAKMMMFMPIAFSVMFFFFPAGLVLYYVVNNVLSIAQQYYITRMMGASKKKPA